MNGRTWAYIGLFLGLTASITANTASTVLITNGVSLWLRVPFAVIWPVTVYVAIEVLIRTDWRKTWSDIAIRLVIVGPVSTVAAVVSYLHQSHLMRLAGETGLAVAIGPLAIDGMLFGMTATLIRKAIVTRTELPIVPLTQAWSVPTSADPSIVPNTADEIIGDWAHEADIVAPISAPPAARKPRAKWDAVDVVNRLLQGEKPADVVTATDASRASVMRIAKVVRELRSNPRAAIDPKTEKVPTETVAYIREAVSK